MSKILGRIEKALRKIGAVSVALGFARGRVKHFADIWHKANDARKAAEERVEELRAAGDAAGAARQGRKARRKKRRASNARDRHEKWLGRVKVLAQRKHELKRHKEELDADLEQWKHDHQARVKGKHIVGGEDVYRRIQFALMVAAARCAAGQRPNRYSMPGRFSAEYLIAGEPYGYRTDCSQFGSSVYWACNLPDPGGEGFDDGWTGSIEQKGIPCDEVYARTHAGCAILYGSPGRTHHVEWSLGDGSNVTVGHGSPPIDRGVFDLFGDGNYRCFKFNLN